MQGCKGRARRKGWMGTFHPRREDFEPLGSGSGAWFGNHGRVGLSSAEEGRWIWWWVQGVQWRRSGPGRVDVLCVLYAPLLEHKMFLLQVWRAPVCVGSPQGGQVALGLG